MNQDVLANIAANLEADFSKYADSEYTTNISPKISIKFEVPGMEGIQQHNLEVIAVHNLQTTDYLYENGQTVNVTGPKAIAFKDEAGNLYVHFNGTGDGKWGYNTQAYDGQPSVVQEQALTFFNEVVQNHYENTGTGNVYVSGHSQGGNTAQYVTINSHYGDYIDTCISLDGPGFSEQLIQDAINQHGEAFFDRQCDKIYAYNGESDFVSPLGQTHIIPEGHTTVVSTPSFETSHNPYDAHVVTGMLTNGSLNLPPEGTEYHDSPFREFIKSFAAEVTTLPQEDQARAAELAMKFAEYYLGNGKISNQQTVLTQQDLDDFTELLIPLLVDYLNKNPGMLAPALEYLGVNPDTAALIESIIKNFNDLPEDRRKDALEALFGCLIINEDGSIGFDADLKKIIAALVLAAPALIEAATNDPATVYSVLNQFGVIEMIQNYIKDNAMNIFAIAIAIVTNPILLSVVVAVTSVVVLAVFVIDALYAIVEQISDLAQDIKEFILQTLQSIKEAIGKIKEYLRKNSPGGKYASSNPYFSADPALLREYARRLGSINSRLRDLDRDLNDLYWQVGFLDLWDILQANILTSYSVNVRLCQGFLNTAADKFEAADNTALQYMGG